MTVDGGSPPYVEISAIQVQKGTGLTAPGRGYLQKQNKSRGNRPTWGSRASTVDRGLGDLGRGAEVQGPSQGDWGPQIVDERIE